MASVVLILEDDKNISDLLRDRLDEEGYKVKVALTGADAILQLKNKSPDIITLDIQLPDSNGLKILKELKADPEIKKIPVVVISSCDEDKQAMELGAEKFLHKPIDFNLLFSVLKEIKTKYAVNRDA